MNPYVEEQQYRYVKTVHVS